MKTFFLLASLSFTLSNYSSGQITCIFCYDQNDSISSGVTNLLLNGSFENTNCVPWPSSASYCPNSSSYGCNIANWTCTGGGPSTYTYIFDNTYVVIPDGAKAAYFGNAFCKPCSGNLDDTSCLSTLSCSATGVPPGYPINDPAYGGATGVSLQQTVTGLIPGNLYVLEFWAGGEWNFTSKGLFAVDVGFGDTLLRCPPTGLGAIGTTYVIEFIAGASSQTIKFTNWGHICSYCTELVLDHVRLYTAAQLSSTVIACFGSSSGSSSFIASDTVLCEKFCINFFDSSTNNPTAWQWLFPGGTPSSSTDQNPASICYQNPGIYDVTLITTTAGGNDTLTLPNYITVNPTPPFPTITQVGYTLTSSLANSYQWQLNTVDIPGANNQSYIATQSGLYTVIVGDANGCKNSADKDVTISGIYDAANDVNISVYPNPATDDLTVQWLKGFVGTEITISLFNAIGQEVFSSTSKISSAHWAKKIDLNDSSAGVYSLEIKTQNLSLKKKIIITK